MKKPEAPPKARYRVKVEGGMTYRHPEFARHTLHAAQDTVVDDLPADLIPDALDAGLIEEE